MNIFVLLGLSRRRLCILRLCATVVRHPSVGGPMCEMTIMPLDE